MTDRAQERWLTYAEVGELLGCTPSAARARAQRYGWPRRAANAIGGYTKVQVPESLGQEVGGAPPVRRNTSGVYGTALVNGAAPPQGAALDAAYFTALVAPLEGAVAALTTQLQAANEQLGVANRRIDELLEDRRGTIEGVVMPLREQLNRERSRADGAERQLGELRPALADAVAAERITAGVAAGLRAEIERSIAQSRRPWWRRWFR